MKAKFFLLGLCALGLAACSIDEVSQVNDTNAVTFKATTATRATATTTNSLQSFTVWAWNGTTEFMDGVTATKSGNVFTTSPLYFWPTGTVDFYALSPAAEVVGIEDGVEYAYLGGKLNEVGDEENPSLEYTGNVAKAKIANGAITIDAQIPGSYDEQIDLVYAVTKEQSSGSVPMNFRHALSQVVFKASNTNSELTVNIAGVSVCSVYKTGTYYVPAVNTTTNLPTDDLGTGSVSDSQGYWDTEAHKARFAAGIDNTTLVGISDPVTLTSTDGALMLLPQEVEAWDVLADSHDTELGSYFRINCSIFEDGAQLWPNENEAVNGVIPEYAEIAIPCDIDWEEGYRYTYTFIFGDGAGYYPPDDPNYDLDGTPILVPVTFTVSVDEFQNAGNKDVSTETDLSYIEVSSQTELEQAIRSGYQEIALVADITLEDHNLVFDYDCVLDLNGYTLTGVDYTADSNPCGSGSNSVIFITAGTLTVNGPGTIMTNGTASDDNGGYGSGDTDVFWLAGGNLIVYGGTYYGGSWQDPTGETYAASSSCVYSTEGFAYIYDGEFYSGWSKTLGAITILNCKNDPWREGTANIYCYGGSYAWDPSYCTNGPDYGFVADGYGVVYNEETELYDVVYTTVATPADLQALVNGGASEITVTEDITLSLDFPHLDFTSDCTLNLADGVVITPYVSVYGDGTAIMSDGVSSAAIKVSGCTLTVNAGEGAGIETDGASDKADTGVFIVDNGGVLVINSGTYKGANWDYDCTDSSTNTNPSETVYAYYGNVYIYGGTFYGGPSANYKSDGFKIQVGEKDCTENNINCKDSYRESGDSWFYVYGGTFRNEDPANNATEGANTNYVVTGYTSTSSGPDADGNYWFTVTAE